MQEPRLDLRFGARCGAGRNGGRRLFLFASSALDTGGLAPEIAQVIQPCPANFTLPNHLNRADGWRMERENELDADAKTDPAHRKCGARRAALLGDHHTFECLVAFLDLFAFTFLQSDVVADGVTRAKLGDDFAKLSFI